MVNWQGSPIPAADFPEFITRVPRRRSGTLQYTETMLSIKRQMHSNRGQPFAVYRKIPNTCDYELAFWLDSVPNTGSIPWDMLDEYLDDLLS